MPIQTEILDIEAVLKPINQQYPTGKDLRLDVSAQSIYYLAKEARNHSRQIERLHLQGEISNLADLQWDQVFSLSLEILLNTSKDLEVCCWLIEALIRKHQFLGLTVGLNVTRLLIENFWENMFPQPEDNNDFDTKIAALASLNGNDGEGCLILPIAYISITEGQSAGPFAYWQLQRATTLQQISDPELRNKRTGENITMKQIEIAVNETNPQFFQNLEQDLQNAISEWSKLSNLLSQKCGAQAPVTSHVLRTLTQFHEHLRLLTKGKSQKAASIKPIDLKTETDITVPENESSTILNRNDAMNKLLTIAQYFKQTEPHSPLSYVLERCVRWGKLSLPELYIELVKNDDERKQIFRLTGIEYT